MIILRYVTDADPISATIRDFEYGFWASHVEALMPDDTLLGAHYDGGVMARKRDYDKGQFIKELYVNIPASEEMTNQFFQFLRDQIGKPYDTRAILGLVIQRDWRDPSAWFCSELITAALEKCTWIPTLATDVNHITPRDSLLIVSSRVALTS
jgi:hypothetical protein